MEETLWIEELRVRPSGQWNGGIHSVLAIDISRVGRLLLDRKEHRKTDVRQDWITKDWHRTGMDKGRIVQEWIEDDCVRQDWLKEDYVRHHWLENDCVKEHWIE